MSKSLHNPLIPEDHNSLPDSTDSAAIPADETPAAETPVEEAPVEEAPVEEAPVEETPVEEAPVEETPVEETPVEEAPVEEAPVEAPPATTYRWTYADQVTHDKKKAKRKKNTGVLVYALVMTVVFLISFSLLLGVLALGFLTGNTGSGGASSILRPGISDSTNDDEAVVAVEQAKRSVVVIEVRTTNGGGTGTGIIMTDNGYIATNHHVVEDGLTIKVTFYDGTTASAELVGSSEADDLAVIKVNRTGLPAATFAYSDECYVGQTVYAIGTPAGPEFGWTTTKGIISYKDREIKMYDDDGLLQKKLRLIQTDANVNPGNSGGPLVNDKSEVVGIVSMKLADGYEGIGFAIPSDGAVEILEAIMKDGHANDVNSSVSHKRPWLGITGIYLEGDTYYLITSTGVQKLTDEEAKQYRADEMYHPAVSGIYVVSLTEGLDAANKLAVGDIITHFEGEVITSMDDLADAMLPYSAGDTVTMTIYRKNAYKDVDITLSAKPNS